MDNELLNEIHMVKNHAESTRNTYKNAMDKYTKFKSLSKIVMEICYYFPKSSPTINQYPV